MNKIRVCLLNDSFPPIIDGVSNAVVNYAKIITEKWGKAGVVTPACPGADDSVFNFPVYRYPSIDMRKKTTGYVVGIPFSPTLSTALSKHRPDILHAHCPMISALMTRALYKRCRAPMILTYHTKYDIDIANVVKSEALQNSSIKSLVANTSVFDEVWVVSKGAGENLRSLGYQGDYIIMPNGVDLPKERACDSNVMRDTAGYDLPENVPVFLFVGRLMWYKGIQIILDALKMLMEDGKDFRMVMIGSGADEDEIYAYMNILGLEDKVIFTGTISDREKIRSWYTRADLFLFPSTFDSNGLVVREAAACGLASVLIKGSCAAEDVTDVRNALLIEENAQSMYAMLLKVMDNKDYMRQTGEHASDDLYLSWDDAVAKAVERYYIVKDNFDRGKYRAHDSFSDALLATQGDLMYTVGQIGNALNQDKQRRKVMLREDERGQRAIKSSRNIVRKKRK